MGLHKCNVGFIWSLILAIVLTVIPRYWELKIESIPTFNAHITAAPSKPQVVEDTIHKNTTLVATLVDYDVPIEIANDVNYGLTGYVWTGDMGRALRVADALEAGMIWLNSENVRHLPTPFGGMKASGIGRDGGDYSFDFYMETKHVSLARGTHKIQKLGI